MENISECGLQKLDEIELNMQQFKENIQSLIEEGLIEEAKKMLKQYEEVVKIDIDIYSIKGIISMIEGNLEEAEGFFKELLIFDPLNKDFLYNMAYLYEVQEKYIESYIYYKRALEHCDLKMKYEIINKLKRLEGYIDLTESYKSDLIKSDNSNPVISLISFVYNSKEYIEECIESVLTQSLTKFEWLILDNGCTDGTSEILEKYAQKDSRIKLFKNKCNIFNSMNDKDYSLDGYNKFTNYRKELKTEYVALLDSDDFLQRNFCRDLYIAAKKYDIDIAIAGTKMFQDENRNIYSRRCPPTAYLGNISEAGDCFSDIYISFRSLWGKLIRTNVYINTIFPRTEGSSRHFLNGGDTYLCLGFLKNSNSMISLNRVLHYYRIRDNSHYNSQVNKDRYLDYLIIYQESKRLLEVWNKFNESNNQFITEVLYHSMRDCIEVSVKTIKAPIKDRIGVVSAILSDLEIRDILNKKGMYINLIEEATKALDIISK